MILNEKIFNEQLNDDGSLKTDFIWQVYQQHSLTLDRYKRLKAYYDGKHDILSREKKAEGLSNIKTVTNFPKYITTMATSFFIGEPITYAASENIEALNEAFYNQTIEDLDVELETDCSIYGKAYELIYANEGNEIKSVKCPIESIVLIKDDTAEANALCGLRFSEIKDIHGNTVSYCCDVYTSSSVFHYEGKTSSTLKLAEATENILGEVPIIEYLNNPNASGDFEAEIPNIDAYNILMSDRINDKADFVDAFLLLTGIDISSDTAKKLKKEKILCGEVDGNGRYLNKVLSEADTEILRNAIRADIHTDSMVPDLTDEAFAGNLSGVAIKYKMHGLKVLAQAKKRGFRKGLTKRLRIYVRYLSMLAKMKEIPISDIDIGFHFTILQNETDVAELVSKLYGVISDETLFEQIPFVTDAKEEVELARKDNEAKQKALFDVDYANRIDEE